jgi:hypothetical protein
MLGFPYFLVFLNMGFPIRYGKFVRYGLYLLCARRTLGERACDEADANYSV